MYPLLLTGAPRTQTALQGVLPLRPAAIDRVALIGPFVDEPSYILG